MKELVSRNLDILQPSDRSSTAKWRRRALFGELFGLAGREYYRGIRDGSLARSDLSRFKTAINTHFFETATREYAIPEDIDPQIDFTLAQEAAIMVVGKIVEKAFPRLERRLGQFKNEVLFKAPSPVTLFKVLALPEDQVGKKIAFQVLRHILISDSSARLNLRSKGANVRQRVADWNDIFDEELFESPYGSDEEYKLDAYHDNLTNRVTRFQRNGFPKPPREGENFATHEFTARRVKGYGLVYVEVKEEDPVSSTINALIKAANNGGEIRPTQDVRGSMSMMFVDLEDHPAGCQGAGSNRSHLSVLKEKIMSVMRKHMEITEVIDSSNRSQGVPAKYPVADSMEFYMKPNGWEYRNVQDIPIKLEFLKRWDYLNKIYDIGVKSSVENIPVPVYNGQAEDLAFFRKLYPLVEYLFPPQIFNVDAQLALIRRIDEKAKELRERCTAQINYFNFEGIKQIIGQSAP